jgi:hypothetical protein
MPQNDRKDLEYGLDDKDRDLIVYVLLGISPASYGGLPTLRNLLSGPSSMPNHNTTPGKYPEEHTQYSEHGESLKSRIGILLFVPARKLAQGPIGIPMRWTRYLFLWE